MSIRVYGIKNCNTMKKVFNFLEENGVSFEFVDYKKQKPTIELLKSFLQKVSLSTLVNKQGTTYRKMDENQKAALEEEETALPILVEHPSMIKRPIIDASGMDLLVGLDLQKFQKLFS
ncbi:Spx/MgsR family RNA polymerase-binding regulatory protein [Algoriphagus confluentis]|uniref:ArsC family reductase n=1 Tax=Algoriphagus confluentis TaxID=1697556 RepID=A0ABQ6PVA7_9BACT|nr:ArsC family reductase [Algoriphagus confluentis]